MPNLYRGDQARVQVAFPNNPEIKLDTKSWDAIQGGDVTASDVNYPPGGMEPSVNLGGIPTRGDITVTRIWSDTLIAAYKAIDNACGRALTNVTYSVLDANAKPVAGSTITYVGVLKSVSRPDYDSATAAEAKLQIIVGLGRAIA